MTVFWSIHLRQLETRLRIKALVLLAINIYYGFLWLKNKSTNCGKSIIRFPTMFRSAFALVALVGYASAQLKLVLTIDPISHLS